MANDPTGWCPFAERVPFREFAHSGVPEDNMYPQAIVHHVMTGYFSGARQMAETYPVGKPPSWHFSIARDGRVMQHVSIWDTAWHCGIDGTITPDPLVQRFRNLWGRDPNSWTIGVEHEGFSEEWWNEGRPVHDYVYGPDHPWPEAMIQASIKVQRWVWQSCQWLVDLPSNERYDRFLTHAMINPRDRPNDPGQHWDATVWHRIANGVFVDPTPAPAPVPTPPSVPAPVPSDYDRGWNQAWNQALDQAILAIHDLKRR